jgi:hypothetical protein
MTLRYFVFDVPHKGLRNGLAQFTLLAGKTDYTNPQQVATLYQVGQEIFLFLSSHAADENTVSLAELENRAPNTSKHISDDHDLIHHTQSELENLLENLHSGASSDKVSEGKKFYDRLNLFHADYLRHMTVEDSEIQDLLWDNFSDEELMGHRNKIMGTMPPQTLLVMFKYIIAALSPAERIGLLQGFKMNVPEPFFNQSLDVIRPTLNQAEWDALTDGLA